MVTIKLNSPLVEFINSPFINSPFIASFKIGVIILRDFYSASKIVPNFWASYYE